MLPLGQNTRITFIIMLVNFTLCGWRRSTNSFFFNQKYRKDSKVHILFEGCLGQRHQILHLATSEKENLVKKDPCVDYWLTLAAPLPTWSRQWFVSGMAELLSGRRAYVTGAADNTWVLSWGVGRTDRNAGRQRGQRSLLYQPAVGWGAHGAPGTQDAFR